MTTPHELARVGGWKGAGLDLLAGVVLLGSVVWGSYSYGRRSVDVDTERRRADHATQREATAKASAKAALDLAEERLREVGRLRGELGKHPAPPPAEPVAPDASTAVVAGGLSGLGLHPVLLGADPALGLNLPDGRTVLSWGREAQRVPPLVVRLETLERLAQAQEGATGALHQQAADLAVALRACDEGREAERKLAQRLVPIRPWSFGILTGIDTAGTRRVGAYASRSWGPVQVQVVVLGNQAAIGGGLRF